MNGHHNRLARIDLSTGSVTFTGLDSRKVELFIGGSGLGAAYLAEMIGPKTDPLGPDNPLILMTGPFSETLIPMSTRHSYVTLSPLTGIFTESSCGGSFAHHLKRSGLDGLIITGAAPRPSTLVVDGPEVYLRPADDLWGRDAFSVDEILKEEFDSGGVTAIIGPAGENLVRYASVSHNGRHTRSAGRCGIGAVMGAKKLKAMVVTSRGTEKTPVAEPEALRASMPAVNLNLKDTLKSFGRLGTAGGLQKYERVGNLPIGNWREATAPDLAAKITGTEIVQKLMVKRSGCFRCPVCCGRLVKVNRGPYATDGAVEGPEYETAAVMGSLCKIDDIEAITKANELCNQLGLDTLSTGGAIAFAMEANERGLISQRDLDGVDLSFGNARAMVQMIDRIARREGTLARLLGEGVQHAAESIGGSAAEFAVTIKGLEFPMHDPRFSWGQALSFATSNRGACHLAGLCHMFETVSAIPELGYDEPFPSHQRDGKAAWVIAVQHLMTIADALCLCKFAFIMNAVSLGQIHRWFVQVRGEDCSLEEFMGFGERIFNLKRMINGIRGISRKDDVLPPRMRTLKRKGKDYIHDVPPINQMLSDYYELRGWSEDGRPTRKTIKRLGLSGFPEVA